MELIKNIIDFVLHIDVHLNTIVQNFGVWTYLLLFAIIFAETGLVITPFLPGDSLLFAVGALSAIGTLNIFWMFIILVAAAIMGDSVNYAIGNIFGDRLLKAHSRVFKEEYIVRTHRFFEKYGGKTIVLARFVPIVRTFAPFVAGLGNMSYRYFLMYNIAGAVLWVSIFVFGGYLFGNLPIVKHNFTLVIFVIIIISILPGVIEYIKHKKRKR